MKQEQEGGDKSVNVQAAGNILLNSLSAADVRVIAELVFEKNLPQMLEAAKAEAKENAQKFLNELSKKAADKLTPEEMAIFSTADMQYALTHAVIQASRKDVPEKSTLLASLIIEKAKCSGGVRDIAITQAIEISAKLIKPHFSLLAFVYVTRHITWGWTDFEAVKSGVKNTIKNFSDLTLSGDGMGILISMGCASHEVTFGKLQDQVNKRYENVLPKKFNDKFGRMSDKDGEEFWASFDLTTAELEFINTYNKSGASSLFLTPVGKVIALSYMQTQNLIDYDWKLLITD
ncbi:LPO_1073/Vpar_1526 family protein [Ferrovibrio terrae]|uniref:LPO_1073/Vpar_1526 family protein n=1 Tax=Ferrovibrio terrae TaxID=2594003 RepID=UPI003137FD91